MQSLKQSKVVISGAASGLGEACADYLAKLQAKLYLLDQDKDKLVAVAEKTKAQAIPCDITDEAALKLAFDQIAQNPLPLRVCINCAGIAAAAKLLDREGQPQLMQHFQQVINVNLLGSINVMRFAASLMQKTAALAEGERGVIINTASIAAYEGQVGQIAYSASKGGIVALTLPAARELGRYGIRVMALAPGLFDTPMMHGLPENVQTELQQQLPFPRRFGRPEEFAAACWHIISNSMLNGSVIRLDAALRMI